MNLKADIQGNIVKDILFQDCLKRNANYKLALLDYYDGILKSKLASTEQDCKIYSEARHIIAVDWMKIARFAYDISKQVGLSIKSLMKLFKNPLTIKLFSMVGWSFKTLFSLLKTAHKKWNELFDIIFKYAEKVPYVKGSKEWLEGLDKYMKDHPVARRITGVVIAGMFIYLFFVVEFTFDVDFDFDSSEVVDGLSGNFSLVDIFHGAAGIKFLSLIVAGTAFRLSFPWPGATSVHFIVSILYTLAKKAGIDLKKIKNKLEFEDEVNELGLGVAT